MIQLKNIIKIYNKGKSNEFEALKGINVDIKDGEMVSIIGKSGAGKSTLLHILAGIDSFESGSYHVGETDIGKMSEKQLARFRNEMVGIVMQDFALIEDYTVAENLMIPLVFGKIPKKKHAGMIDKVLAEVDMSDLRDKLVNQLSGGQKQRVAIARAIINSPQFILADEPTGALDQKTAVGIMELFRKLNREGHTVLIVTHDMDVAQRCQRNIEIQDGRIVYP